MVIKLSITATKVFVGGGDCSCSKERLEEELQNYFDSCIIEGWKVTDCKVIKE